MANIYNMIDTWNDGTTTFTAIKMNVTDTDSASDSLLMDLQVGGSSKFSVDKSGNALANEIRLGSLTRISQSGNGVFTFGSSGFGQAQLGTGGLVVTSNASIGFGSSNTVSFTSTTARDVILARDAANTLAQRNGTNAQTFNLYNTYTDASNYERLAAGAGIISANIYSIEPQKSGTGGSREFWLRGANAQYIRFKTDGTTDFAAASGGVNFSTASDRNNFNKTIRLAYDETVASLPASPAVGMISRVTDGDSGLTFGNTVVNSGAGATPYLVWYNGTNWTVIGA